MVVKITMTTATSGTLKAEDSMDLKIGYTPLIASIVGGSRSVGVPERLRLTAVIVDADTQEKKLPNSVTFSWMCVSPITGEVCDLRDAAGKAI